MSLEKRSKASRNSQVIGLHLKHERELRAWTQSDVAERIGATQINVSRWENGMTVPGPYYRQKLGELFGKSMKELGFISESHEISSEEASIVADDADSLLSPFPLPIWNLPYRRNPFFTGREAILSHLYTMFRSGKAAALTQPQAISGLGGIGKTQIAIEYAHRYRDSYQAIFWLTASTRDELGADFVMLAALLNLPEQNEPDQDIVIRAIKRWLTAHTHWLLILDNVDNLEMVAAFLPVHSPGDVIITTRLQALGVVAQSIEVETMGQDEGTMFLLRRTKLLAPDTPLEQATEEHQQQAAAIFTTLDGLPLALDQAGAYIEETRCGLSQYLSLYGIRRKELLLRRGMSPVDHPASVVATWSLSFQKIQKENPTAADLLCLLSFLSPEAIPEELLILGAVEFGSLLETAANDPLEVNILIELLLHYSLIRRIPETQSLSIHRLVQAVLRDTMDREAQRFWMERIIRGINRALPEAAYQTWEGYPRYLPHIQLCAAYCEEYALNLPEAARLFHDAAFYLMAHAAYEYAKELLLKALAIREHLLEPDHPVIARTLNDLGVLYRKQAVYEKAELCLQQALVIRQQAYGKEHLDVALTLHNLADLYRTQGAYIKAEPLYLRTLEIREAKLEAGDPLIARSYYSLAMLYRSQENYRQAEKFCLLALHLQEQRLGPGHSMVGDTLSILAKVYQGQKRFNLAEEVHKRALAIRENASGKDHPRVATVINNLVELYHAEGRYRDAEPLVLRALRIHEQSLGSKHPYMAYSLNNRAENLFLQGDYRQAEAFYKEALAIREQRLGSRHPHIASTYYHLARLFLVLERFAEAEAFCSEALSIREEVFGPDHPIIVATLEQYIHLLKKLQRADEACELEARVRLLKASQITSGDL